MIVFLIFSKLTFVGEFPLIYHLHEIWNKIDIEKKNYFVSIFCVTEKEKLLKNVKISRAWEEKFSSSILQFGQNVIAFMAYVIREINKLGMVLGEEECGNGVSAFFFIFLLILSVAMATWRWLEFFFFFFCLCEQSFSRRPKTPRYVFCGCTLRTWCQAHCFTIAHDDLLRARHRCEKSISSWKTNKTWIHKCFLFFKLACYWELFFAFFSFIIYRKYDFFLFF